MEKEISWSAPEYHTYEKNVSWYWLVILGTVVIAGIALWQKNFLFALFIVVASFLVTAWGDRKPRTLDFVLSEQGLEIGEQRHYSFDEFSGFAIIPTREDPELHELLFHVKGRIGNWLKIIIATQRHDAIKAFLAAHLPELEYEESFAEHIGRMLKF
jgi:hypothetical protein